MLTASIQHCARGMNNAVRKEKETKDISGKNWKGKNTTVFICR